MALYLDGLEGGGMEAAINSVNSDRREEGDNTATELNLKRRRVGTCEDVANLTEHAHGAVEDLLWAPGFASQRGLTVMTAAETMEDLDFEKQRLNAIQNAMSKLDAMWHVDAMSGVSAAGSAGVEAFFQNLGEARMQIFEWTRDRMEASQGARPVEEWEFISFLAMLLWKSLTNLSNNSAITSLEGVIMIARRSGIDALISQDRYTEICEFLSGFDHHGPPPDSFEDPFEVLEQSFADFVVRRVELGKSIVIHEGLPLASKFCIGQSKMKLDNTNLKSTSCYDACFPIHLFSTHAQSETNDEQLILHALQRLKVNKRVSSLYGVCAYISTPVPSARFLRACANMNVSLVSKSKHTSRRGGMSPFIPWPVFGGVEECTLSCSSLGIPAPGAHAWVESFASTATAEVKSSYPRDHAMKAHALAVRVPDAGNAVDHFILLSQSGSQNLTLSESLARIMHHFVVQPMGIDVALERQLYSSLSMYEPEADEQIFPGFVNKSKTGTELLSNPEWSSQDIETGWRLQLDAENEVNQDDEELFDFSDTILSQKELHTLPTLTSDCLEKMLGTRLKPLTLYQCGMDWNVLQSFVISEDSCEALFRDTSTFTTAPLSVLSSDSSLKLAQILGDPLQFVPESFTETQEAAILCDEWLQMPKDRPPAEVSKRLRSLRNVEAVFSVGLLHLQDNLAIACAPAAVCVVHPQRQGDLNTSHRILCPAEVCMASQQGPNSAAIRDISNKHGNFSIIKAGSKNWLEMIPRPFRIRLLHSAYVMGVPCGLFSMATNERIEYTAIVHFPEEVQELWGILVNEKAKTYAQWAWNHNADVMDPSVIPSCFEGSRRAAIRGRFQIWSGFRTQTLGKEKVLPPLQSMHSVVKVIHEQAHTGFHLYDKSLYSLNHEPSESTMYESNIVRKKIFASLTNTAILWNAHQLWREKGVEGVDSYLRGDLHASVINFVEQISLNLLSRAEMLREDRASEVVETAGPPMYSSNPYESVPSPVLSAEAHAKLRIPDKKRGVIDMANSHTVRQLRLSANTHREETLKKPRRCVLCGEAARKQCAFCNVVLHKQIKYSTKQRASCWTQWHSHYNIKRVTIDKKSKKKSSSLNSDDDNGDLSDGDSRHPNARHQAEDRRQQADHGAPDASTVPGRSRHMSVTQFSEGDEQVHHSSLTGHHAEHTSADTHHHSHDIPLPPIIQVHPRHQERQHQAHPVDLTALQTADLADAEQDQREQATIQHFTYKD